MPAIGACRRDVGPPAPRGGLLSSAILYVAIVVIWACVLIPRWLRRDTSVAVAASAEQAGDEASVAAVSEEEPLPEPAPAPRRRGSAASAEQRQPVRDENHGAPAARPTTGCCPRGGGC